MRIDLVIPNQETYGLEAVRACGDFEKMGYDGLWFTDHVVGFEVFKPVYGAYWLEILTALTHAAAITERVRLGTGVLVIPYRDAVYTAKLLSSIDVLSNGRLDLGVGTGWSRAEFFALGRAQYFEKRGAYTNEALDVMQLCWNAKGEEELAYAGEFHNFRKMQFQPVPVQQPRIPLWIGARGTAPAPLRRTVKYADVWHPTGISPEELKEGSARINDMAGREIPVSIRTQKADGASSLEVADQLAAYRDAGCIQAAVDLRARSMADFVSGAEGLIEAAAPLRDS